MSDAPGVRRPSLVPGKFWVGVHPCGICGEPVDSARGVFLAEASSGRRSLDPLGFTEDHVVPRALGGADTWENLQPAHSLCNSTRGKREVTAVLRRALAQAVRRLAATPEAKATLIITCGTCEAPVLKERARVEKYGAAYCSRACHAQGLRRRVAVTCRGCGAGFEVTRSRWLAGRGRYCTKACRASSGVDKVAYECEACGRGFWLSQDNRKPSAQRHCSTCRKLKRRKAQRGT